MHNVDCAHFNAPAMLGSAAFALLSLSSGASVAAAPIKVSNSKVAAQNQSSPAFQRTVAWGILKARVMRWAELPVDWDGRDGTPPSETVTSNALSFIDQASRFGATIPSPYVSGDGEIGFRWAKGDSFASVAFIDGDVVAYVRNAQSGELYKLDCAYAEAEYSNILTALRAFS